MRCINKNATKRVLSMKAFVCLLLLLSVATFAAAAASTFQKYTGQGTPEGLAPCMCEASGNACSVPGDYCTETTASGCTQTIFCSGGTYVNSGACSGKRDTSLRKEARWGGYQFTPPPPPPACQCAQVGAACSAGQVCKSGDDDVLVCATF